jgi:hypothetical protein
VTDSPESEIVVPENETEARVMAAAWAYNPDLDFRKLALEAQYHAKGFRLVSKAQLIGVPHVIVGVTYREGFPRGGRAGDYVSVEAVVADKDTLETPPVKSLLPAELEVWGNEPVVYNDSGTGIRRILTQLFHTAGLIDVGKPAKDSDENVFDRPYQFWAAGEDLATTGLTEDTKGVPFRYLAFRGLRRSDYESPYGPATTFYFG